MSRQWDDGEEKQEVGERGIMKELYNRFLISPPHSYVCLPCPVLFPSTQERIEGKNIQMLTQMHAKRGQYLGERWKSFAVGTRQLFLPFFLFFIHEI